MNSYPPELLTQLAPIMFVAGLDAFPVQSSQPSTPTSTKPDDFTSLAAQLRDTLQLQRKVTIWQPQKTKIFQVILVDKEIRFPPRKLVPSDDPSYSSAHSPLSPLTPSSPLHPDGLVAPIWIRKHTSLVPSVFVLFLRIFEFSPLNSPRSPLDSSDSTREREQEERRRDAELAVEVALRKKSTNERGIKLTVVLMASRKLLDDPALDARLTFVRRQSGLDSRAALFVLSPVSSGELVEFVKSLQQALYEPALEYYTAHSKRVRRKRNRHSQAIPFSNIVSGSTNIARPLRPEGWTVRYEYKMACFAEFRGEDEVALKHYQDAHSMLVVMFGSTAILPPRTKRWAEAKVLADCINLKICKLYLYNNEHALALSHHNTHVRIFSDFSRGWGIGEETFEYWSWMARQHRVVAELIEQGTHSTLSIPVHKPLSSLSQTHKATTRGSVTGLEIDSIRSSGINPSHALQHPGFYFFLAAKCTEKRRERFLAAMELESSQDTFVPSPGFTNEKKVDHWTLILELYTKAYELFKKHTVISPQSPTQGRLTLWIAYCIAQTYYESGEYDMAIRFFERIAKTYRKELWSPLLQPLLSTWYACAQKLNDGELSVKLLLEMLGHNMPERDGFCIQDDLNAILQNTIPQSDEALTLDSSVTQPIFDCSVLFWGSEAKVGDREAFQISLTAPNSISISSLPISSIEIHFSHRQEPLVVVHEAQRNDAPSLFRFVQLGHVRSLPDDTENIVTCLRWERGGCFVFAGFASSDVPTSLEVTKLSIRMKKGNWDIDVPIIVNRSRAGAFLPPKWLSSINPPRYLPIIRETSSSVAIKHKPHTLTIYITHESPAYLNEKYPITIDILNAGDRPLDVIVDVLLPPTEVDGATNVIILEDESSTNYIKGVSFGALDPGMKAVKTLYLLNMGASADRTIDVLVQSQSVNFASETSEIDRQETVETFIIPTLDPFQVSHSTSYSPSSAGWPELSELNTFEANHWNNSAGSEASVVTRILCKAASRLFLESVQLEKQSHLSARIIGSSADDFASTPCEYHPGDELSHTCRIAIAPSEDSTETAADNVGSYRVLWRRVRNDGSYGSLSATVISLPALRHSAHGLMGLLSMPPSAKLHAPIPLTLTVRNHHLGRAANIVVQLEPDASDGFVVAGLRSGRMPILMPGTEEKITWKLIPIECGRIKIPRVKVTDQRPDFGGATDPGPEAGAKAVDVKLVLPDGRDLSWESGGLGAILVLP